MRTCLNAYAPPPLEYASDDEKEEVEWGEWTWADEITVFDAWAE